MRFQTPIQREQTDVTLRKHREIFPMVDRRQDLQIVKAIFRDRPLESSCLAAVANKQKMNVLFPGKTRRQADDVVDVVCHTQVTAVEKDHFAFQPELLSVMGGWQILLVRTGPIVEDLDRVPSRCELPAEVGEIRRRLHRDAISDVILPNLSSPKETIDEPFSQHPGIDSPGRENIPQNQVGSTAPERFEAFN